ncbi:phage holin [Clostridium beijerinckii]|uniref:phage holin n=1 Tax=Clostridium beijerinckii TaxID=1520 RepID=UPI0014946B05|nr:phage holin [Clostridium beijerinckii]NOW07873.1 phi LC3 family holin [Clostridium beijerinckii]NYC05431.1 phi LC3 family holin [Clostridium beijerinckii]NYC05504.1 phi LC3 family holin [Clostridium beijerinckii]
MITLDLKSRFRNKAFILAMVGAIVLLIQQLGFKDIIPSNYADIVNSILTILTMLGIVVDTSTTGISDKVVSNATIQAINQMNETKEEIKTEDSTTGINGVITENSQDSVADSEATLSDKESEANTTTVDAEAILLENAQLKAQLAAIQTAVTGTIVQA